MASSPARAPQNAELAALIKAAKAGQPKPVYLFIGEPTDTRAAASALIDVLVPAASRAFNLETYDGRIVPIGTVTDSLRMRGFFKGTKVVCVRESSLFVSGEKRGDITKSLLAAWSDGREQDAVEKLLVLVALAGWTQEQLGETRWSTLTKTKLREVFGDTIETGDLVHLDAIHAACLARGLTVSAFRDDSAQFLEFLEAGMPSDTALVFTASAIDARKRLYKRLKEIGGVVELTIGRERSGALSREAVDDLIRRAAQESGKRLAPAAHELILRRAGTDAAMVANELEKLFLYTADQPSISEDDVRVVFRDMAESWIFDFTAAFAARQLARTLPLLRGLFAQGEPPLRLLAMIAREVRLLLIARECYDETLQGKWRADAPFNVFQSRVLPLIDAETQAAFGKAHPFVLYKRFQDASRVPAPALRVALIKLSELDVRLKSMPGDPTIVMEAFVIDWCRGERTSKL